MYIPKDDSKWKCFHNARPITKTSPMYKLLDQILNERLKKEIYPKNKELINPCQTGFKEGLGCEVNILRIVENL